MWTCAWLPELPLVAPNWHGLILSRTARLIQPHVENSNTVLTIGVKEMEQRWDSMAVGRFALGGAPQLLSSTGQGAIPQVANCWKKSPDWTTKILSKVPLDPRRSIMWACCLVDLQVQQTRVRHPLAWLYIHREDGCPAWETHSLWSLEVGEMTRTQRMSSHSPPGSQDINLSMGWRDPGEASCPCWAPSWTSCFVTNSWGLSPADLWPSSGKNTSSDCGLCERLCNIFGNIRMLKIRKNGCYIYHVVIKGYVCNLITKFIDFKYFLVILLL